MNLKHVTVVGITALALVACGQPAQNNAAPTNAAAQAGDTSAGATTAAGGANTSATTAAGGANTSATAASGGTTSSATNTNPSATVARVGEVSLTRGELDSRIKRIQDALKTQGAGSQMPQALDIEKSLVQLFVNEQLTLNVANDRKVSVSDQEVDSQIKQIGQSIQSQGGTLAQAITGQLGYENEQAPEFRQLISSIVAREKIGQTLVTTDTVEKELRADLEKQAKEEVQKADVRHILVKTEDEAKKVIERLDKGEKFEDLAKELSIDPGSKDNGGLYTGVEQGQFVPEFDKATFQDLQPGETTKVPVKTQYGYHVIKLEKREKGPRYTPEQIDQQLKQQVPGAVEQRRQEEFQKLVDAAREKAKSEGRLEEPAYPEPTPEVPGQLPSNVAPDSTPGADAAPTAAAGATAAP